mmetsp:Transcript_11911/g.14574  ORF Transcript_11911/g.14574 Transcript_11911/m.14574 type:complete len:114 (-) Transcript_11911:73-414(-)
MGDVSGLVLKSVAKEFLGTDDLSDLSIGLNTNVDGVVDVVFVAAENVVVPKLKSGSDTGLGAGVLNLANVAGLKIDMEKESLVKIEGSGAAVTAAGAGDKAKAVGLVAGGGDD